MTLKHIGLLLIATSALAACGSSDSSPPPPPPPIQNPPPPPTNPPPTNPPATPISERFGSVFAAIFGKARNSEPTDIPDNSTALMTNRTAEPIDF